MTTSLRMCAAAVLVGVTCQFAAADTLRVPGAFNSIQDAVDAAQPGDLVLVTKGTYTEAVVLDGVTGVTIKGIGISLDGGAAAAVSITDCTDVVVQGLKIVGGAPDAVVVVNSQGTELSKLRIAGHSERGIVVRDSDATTVLRCRVDGGIGNGIDVSGSNDVTVDRCQLLAVAGDGIVLGDPADEGGACNDGAVVRNRVFRPGSGGIRVAGSGNAIESNTVQEPRAAGIELVDAFDGTGNRIFRNRIKKAGDDGMRVGGISNVIERNNMTVTGNLGLSVAGSGMHDVIANRIKKSAEEGIEVQPGAVQCDIERNKVTSSGDDGIDVKAGPARVINNKVVKSGDDGIDINGADGCTIENNVITRSSDFGLQLDASGNTVRFNKSLGSGSFDLSDRAEPGENTYSKNRFPRVDPENDPF